MDYILFVLLLSVSSVDATLSMRFRRFIQNNYGHALEKELSRVDLGPEGSFGGGVHTPRTPTK